MHLTFAELNLWWSCLEKAFMIEFSFQQKIIYILYYTICKYKHSFCRVLWWRRRGDVIFLIRAVFIATIVFILSGIIIITLLYHFGQVIQTWSVKSEIIYRYHHTKAKYLRKVCLSLEPFCFEETVIKKAYWSVLICLLDY